MLTDRKEIKRWLDSMKIENYTIRPDGIVDVDDDVDVDLRNYKGTTFPVQFGNVSGNFYCANTKITSLQGAPSSVGRNFNCANTKITSLQGAPADVGGGFYCYNTKITSLQGIHKIIKQINGRFTCDDDVTHILGLLLIKGITHVNVDSNGPVDNIIIKYLGTGDIISAQDELIDAGLKEQAKL